MNVNDKVVCVFDDWGPWQANPNITAVGPWPVKGKVYVIEALINHRRIEDQGPGLRLVGHTSLNVTEPGEVGYSQACFRKLEDVQAENRAARAAAAPQMVGVFCDIDEP